MINTKKIPLSVDIWKTHIKSTERGIFSLQYTYYDRDN
jgi:hypothetical protein